MSTISVNCPKCRHKNDFPTPSGNSARVVCEACGYGFKISPKPRSLSGQNSAPAAGADKNKKTAPQVQATVQAALQMSAAQSHQARISKLLKQTDASQHDAEENAQTAPQNRTAAKAPSKDGKPNLHSHAKKPQSTPPEKKGGTQAVQQESKLFDPITVPTLSLPARVEKPAQNKTEAGKKTADRPKTDATADTPAADNLVFTLLQTDSETLGSLPLLLDDNIEKTETISVKQQHLDKQIQHLRSEYRWALASLAALTVLVIQLFYLLA